MQIIEISKGYAHWDIDNPESTNVYTAATLKCLKALAFGFTSQLTYPFFLGLDIYI